MRKRTLVLTAGALALFAALTCLALLRQSETTKAQQFIADKAVLEVILDRADNYPDMGTPIDPDLPFIIPVGEPQTMISVTSVDLLLMAEPPPEPGMLNSVVAFYADIPPGCWGRWWDPGPAFPMDIYSIQGQPTAEPLSEQQLGIEVPYPPSKVPGDQDAEPPALEPMPPVLGQTFEADLHFQSLPYGIVEMMGAPIPITRFFDFHCDLPGEYIFWLCNKIEPMPPYLDPNFPQVGGPQAWPGNNVLCVPLVVTAHDGVGGMAEVADTEAAPVESDGGSSTGMYAIAGGSAGLLILLVAGGVYARRRLRAS